MYSAGRNAAETVAEARAELGLGRGAGVAKYNPYHDELGRYTTAEGAVEPEPDRGVEVAENEPFLTSISKAFASAGVPWSRSPLVPVLS